MRLGIDFGTTRTVVAAAIDGRYPVVSFESGTGYCDYVPGIAALGTAARIAVAERDSEACRLRFLRARLLDGILGRNPGVTLNGAPLPAIAGDGGLAAGELEERLPGNLNLSFEGVEGEALLMGLKDIAVSSGSACTSASLQPSHVLKAVGLPDDLAHASIRFGLGRFTTAEEIDFAIAATDSAVRRLREMSPMLSTRTAGPVERA